jgi:tripartite-type tricarboxylate transporter receptor subunit TctC
MGPANLPPTIVSALNSAATKSLDYPDVRSRLDAAGFELRPSTPQSFADSISKGYGVFQRIVTDAGIQPE